MASTAFVVINCLEIFIYTKKDWDELIVHFFLSFVNFAVYPLISRRRFQQIDVLEGQNILVTISGKKSKIRVYYLSWLKGKILKTEGVRNIH